MVVRLKDGSTMEVRGTDVSHNFRRQGVEGSTAVPRGAVTHVRVDQAAGNAAWIFAAAFCVLAGIGLFVWTLDLHIALAFVGLFVLGLLASAAVLAYLNGRTARLLVASPTAELGGEVEREALGDAFRFARHVVEHEDISLPNVEEGAA